MKYILLPIIVSFTVISDCLAQDTIIYIMKCREHLRLRKYSCITLKLLPQNKYEYEEIAGDLPLEISEGIFIFRQDTLTLMPNKADNTPEVQEISNPIFKKFIKYDNKLIDLTNKKTMLKSKRALTPG
jgi:hypothetical protein